MAAYTFVWDLGDFGIALMTILNMIALFPMSKEALKALREYERSMKEREQMTETEIFEGGADESI